jgi:hypothetical protein
VECADFVSSFGETQAKNYANTRPLKQPNLNRRKKDRWTSRSVRRSSTDAQRQSVRLSFPVRQSFTKRRAAMEAVRTNKLERGP